MKKIQCTFVHTIGDKAGQRCNNKRNVHPWTNESTYTCEHHGKHIELIEPRTKTQDILDMNIPGVFKLSDMQTNTLKKEDFVPNNFIVAGTGSRSIQVKTREEKINCVNRIRDALQMYRSEHSHNLVVITGMAEGFDKALALVSLGLGIRTWAFVPNRGYGQYYWGKNSLTRQPMYHEFEDILEQMDKVEYTTEHYGAKATAIYVDPTQPGRWSSRRGKGLVHTNFLRNIRMVEVANAFLVWDRRSSGTAHCLAEIVKANKPYKVLDE